MSRELTEDQAAIVEELEEFKANGDRLAQEFATHRAAVRERALYAVTHYGVSVVRAATAAGVDRRTLTVWLQVFNAEQKSQKK